jgi:Domain of unknown function (DUF4266)
MAGEMRTTTGRRAAARTAALAIAMGASLAGCVTVAPQQRAILADPTMQFDAEAKHEAALRHAIENREGSMGGTGVSGGGCGCN